MTSTPRKQNRSVQRSLPTLLAVGGSLAVLPAAALELGDLRVHSSIGQPLRASIAYALAPNEQLSNRCVSLKPGPTSGGFPGIGRASLSVANGVIKLSGQTAIREPMMATVVSINCPYAPKLSREYMLFVDPQTPAYEQTTQFDRTVAPAANVTPAIATNPARETVSTAPRPRASNANVNRAPTTKDLSSGDRIQVRLGDNLGALTQRIRNRGMSLWPATMIVFEANPDAFMDNDPNKLKAGSWLTVPDFDGAVVATNSQSPTKVTAASATATDVVAEQTMVDAPIGQAPEVVDVATVQTPVDETPVTTNDLQPGIAVTDDGQFVDETIAETVVIPDTDLQGPTTTASSPNVATAALANENTVTGSDAKNTPWLWWLGGSGIAIILGLLLFGRRFTHRSDAGRSALANASTPSNENMARRFSDVDVDTENLKALRETEYNLADESPTEENLALDADLLINSDISEGTDMSVNEDFGFAAAATVDIELPFEPEASSDTTNVLSPLRMDEHSILDSEVLPDSDDFDMSVIVDATKIQHSDDATVHDLHAVVVDGNDDTLLTDNYTISKEVDFEILEQDYEDELTATQALNEEITRAAAELAAQMDNDQKDDATAVLPLASVTELDVTSQLPARNDEISDDDATGVNETLTEVLPRDDNTVEMPVSDGAGDTVDMKLGSGKGR